jgi:MFS family permease
MDDTADGPSPETPPAGALAVLRDRYVRRYLLAQTASTVGVALQTAILFKQLYDLTGSELQLGLIGLVEFAPAVLLVLVTGSIADRYDRRLIATAALSLQALVALALTLYAHSGPTEAWPLYLMAFGYGASRAFAAPAVRSMPPMVAPPGALPRTIALASSVFTAAFILGPAASGFLYAADPWIGYATACGLMVLGVVGMATMKFRQAQVRSGERPTLHTALEGMRFIRRTPTLLGAISLDLFAVLFGGAVALLPAIAEKRLGVGDVGYGWLRAAPGIGMALTALVVTRRPVQRNVGRVLLVVVAVFGVMTILLGITRNYAVAFVALIVLSGADMVSMFIRSTLVPLLVPDETRGRVLAFEMLFIGASNEVGGFESGVAANALGIAGAVISGGVATLLVVGIWWFRFPSLRDVDRFEDIEPERTAPSPAQ